MDKEKSPCESKGMTEEELQQKLFTEEKKLGSLINDFWDGMEQNKFFINEQEKKVATETYKLLKGYDLGQLDDYFNNLLKFNEYLKKRSIVRYTENISETEFIQRRDEIVKREKELIAEYLQTNNLIPETDPQSKASNNDIDKRTYRQKILDIFKSFLNI